MLSTSLPPALEQPCRCFSMAELIAATDNFAEKWCIGHGGFGMVYKGKTSDGQNSTYAIKRAHDISDQGEPEFWVEVEMLSRLRHCNLVSLIGYCNEGKEMALVYEYMHNGSLYDHLHKKGTVFTWTQLLKICIGAARGLDYLHTGTGTQQGVIHRDVKSTNILLDHNYAAKIADFGLAKIGPINQTCTYVSTKVIGTFGYLDPSYVYTGRLTRKSDVYAFGVVLLEVLCDRPALDESLDMGLAVWAQDLIKRGKLSQIVCSSLRDHISKSSLKEFSRIVVGCLHSHPDQRLAMSEVVGGLNRALSFQERKASSIQGGTAIKHVWSLLSNSGHTELRSSEIADISNSGHTELRSSEIADISNSGHTELRSSEIADIKNGSTTRYPVEACAYEPAAYITLLDLRDRTAETERVPSSGGKSDNHQHMTWGSENPEKVLGHYDDSENSIVLVGEPEWNEVYEPGVLVTLSRAGIYRSIVLSKAQFSREKYDEHKANIWWSENREKVYERYNVSLVSNTLGRYYIGPYWTPTECPNSNNEFWEHWQWM